MTKFLWQEWDMAWEICDFKVNITKIKTLGNTRMHSSRMHTACSSSHRGGVSTTPLLWPFGVVAFWSGDLLVWWPSGLVAPDQVPHWEQTPPGADQPPRSRVPQDQARPLEQTPLETCCKACWDTTCKACWDTTPPYEQNSWHTPMKILPCPKLRPRAVITHLTLQIWQQFVPHHIV